MLTVRPHKTTEHHENTNPVCANKEVRRDSMQISPQSGHKSSCAGCPQITAGGVLQPFSRLIFNLKISCATHDFNTLLDLRAI